MSDNVTFVDYQEPLSIRVGTFLLSKGFDIADSTGMLVRQLALTDSLRILRKDPEAKSRKYLFGLIKREPRRMFLGMVIFSNREHSAVNKQEWALEVYGRKHVELVKQLAEEMASTFNVKITLRLVCEQPKVENYLPDY